MSTEGTPRFNGNYAEHQFGHERTVIEIVRRIAWETEAEGFARHMGFPGLADKHASVRIAYTDLLTTRRVVR